MKRAIQKYNKDYVEMSRRLSPLDRLRFVEEFMKMTSAVSQSNLKTSKSKLISMKIPEDFLLSFKLICQQQGVAYQTQIKKLMKVWLLDMVLENKPEKNLEKI